MCGAPSVPGDSGRASARPDAAFWSSEVSKWPFRAIVGPNDAAEPNPNLAGPEFPYDDDVKVTATDCSKSDCPNLNMAAARKFSAVWAYVDEREISTSLVERQNLTMRMQMRRFTRLTNGSARSWKT